MTEGRLQEARTDLESASRIAPTNPQVCLVLTQVYARLKADKLRSATASRCTALANHAPDWQKRATIRDYLAKVYLADGDFPRAISEYREAVNIDPYEEAYRFDLGQALLNRELFAEAAIALEEAHRVFDKSAQIELALGVAYYGQRRFPEAVNAFLRTIALAPEVAQPYVFLGKMIDQAGDRLPEVTQRFQEFQETYPKNYLGGLLLAKAISAASGNSKQEEALLRNSIQLKNDNWENHYELGVLLETRREYNAALEELARSTQLNPNVSATHYHLARVYDRLNRLEAANREREIHRKLTAHEKVTAGMEILP